MSNNKLPDDYVPKFTQDEIAERIVHVSELCFKFIERISKLHPKWPITFDPFIVVNVAQSAMDDIWRYKSFHLQRSDKLSDSIKRAAYFTKWFIRLRPMHVDRLAKKDEFLTNFDPNDGTLMINEAFSIYYSLNTLSNETDGRPIALAPWLHADLLYDFHYRNMSEDALLAIYSSIVRRTKNEDLIINSNPPTRI